MSLSEDPSFYLAAYFGMSVSSTMYDMSFVIYFASSLSTMYFDLSVISLVTSGAVTHTNYESLMYIYESINTLARRGDSSVYGCIIFWCISF